VSNLAGVTKQAPVLEPRIVADVMGHDARECHCKSGISKPGRQSMSGRPARRRGLPRTPREGGLLANRRVGIVQQSIVCVDDIAISQRGWNGGAQTLPILGE